MEFFTGFKWAVPIAFADALAQCRFEEGDTFYDTGDAYNGVWEEVRENLGYWLQVRYPAKSSGSASDAEGAILNANWGSEIRVDLYNKLAKTHEGQISTTQGRLYTALWKGDVTILDKKSVEPQIPLSAKAVLKVMNQATEKARELSADSPVFVMVRDLSQSFLREKFSKVFKELKNQLHSRPVILTPQQAGFIDFEKIAPTIEVVFFPMKSISEEDLHGLIKNAVYVPSKGSRKDMFRLSAHGMIV